MLTPGDPAPWFRQRCTSREDYVFDTVAGRTIVLCFFVSVAEPGTGALLEALQARRDLFDDERAALFGVSCDRADEAQARVGERLPGFRIFWDFDFKISRLYGLCDDSAVPDGRMRVRRVSVVLDSRLRIVAVVPMDDPAQHAAAVIAAVEAHEAREPGPVTAPVLVVPRVFEPEFCRQLIGVYDAQGGEDSGFMREQGGKTVGIIDYGHKRRRDATIQDETLRMAIQQRVRRRLNPEIARAFCFTPTRMERYIVACYDSGEGGYFRPHRDNTTAGTAHRRFAVTINLNAEEYEGGDLRFPEYGRASYRAPTGGAVVFSYSLLHEALPVTGGRRYAFLPFLYDEDAVRVRQANLENIGDESLRERIRSSIKPPRAG